MKIEKVNDNQIRCTLTKQDLADRKIDLRELAYGSEKAKGLFHDMIQQANYEFGFEANDIPLMVEAIPLSSETLILLITKVEYPEELDTRFSKFSEPDEDMLFTQDASVSGVASPKGADDILDMFHKLCEEQKASQKKNAKNSCREETPGDEGTPKGTLDLTKLFVFSSMEQLERLAHVLCGFYHGVNDLYRDNKKQYCLFVHKSGHTPEEFNKVCNMICEYGTQKNYSAAVGAYYDEHAQKILSHRALQVLAKL